MEKQMTEPTENVAQFLREVEELEKVEEKIRHALQFMRSILAQDKPPSFRDFWQVKQHCLDLFKEKLPARTRTIFWKEYAEISDEMRRLKDLMDEESFFAKEQIELAIQGIEKELMDGEEKPLSLEIPKASKSLQKSGKEYLEKQGEIARLHPLGKRVNELRKEVLKTSMRTRTKNQFLSQLSKLGDQIFPKRRELIDQLSSEFVGEVERFIGEEFHLDTPPFFPLKEEIKALQGFAKELSLSSASFTKVRTRLSECWEKIREKEEAHRKDRHQENLHFQKNVDQISAQITPLKKGCEEGEITLAEADKKVEEILRQMRELPLRHIDVVALKKELFAGKKILEDREAKIQKALLETEEKKKREEAKRVGEYLNHLEGALEEGEPLSPEILEQKLDALVKEGETLFLEGYERELVDCRLGALKDLFEEKKEAEGVSELDLLLEERREVRLQVKEALERARARSGGSGQSLEESFSTLNLLEEQKRRMSRLEHFIETIEEKLYRLEEE